MQRQVKRSMTMPELNAQLQGFKFKLWQHLEERSTGNAHTGYVDFLERNIAHVKKQMEQIVIIEQSAKKAA